MEKQNTNKTKCTNKKTISSFTLFLKCMDEENKINPKGMDISFIRDTECDKVCWWTEDKKDCIENCKKNKLYDKN